FLDRRRPQMAAGDEVLGFAAVVCGKWRNHVDVEWLTRLERLTPGVLPPVDRIKPDPELTGGEPLSCDHATCKRRGVRMEDTGIPQIAHPAERLFILGRFPVLGELAVGLQAPVVWRAKELAELGQPHGGLLRARDPIKVVVRTRERLE